MKETFFILIVIAFCSCCNSEIISSETESEVYPITKNTNLKSDSLLYAFDIKKGNYYIYWLQFLKYHKIDSVNIYQGDIELSSNVKNISLADTSIINSNLNKIDSLDMRQKLIGKSKSDEKLWGHKKIRFKISEDGNTPNLRGTILKAISEWEKTGLQFEEITNSFGDFVLFESLDSYKFNSSPVGRQGGQQKIRLSPNALPGNVIHEIGHSIGLWHEHSRPDRNNYIKINYNNIEPGFTSEFEEIKGPFSYHSTSYDYESIMHYGENAFAKTNGSGTKLTAIQPLKSGVKIGQRSKLSPSDISGVKKMYQL